MFLFCRDVTLAESDEVEVRCKGSSHFVSRLRAQPKHGHNNYRNESSDKRCAAGAGLLTADFAVCKFPRS